MRLFWLLLFHAGISLTCIAQTCIAQTSITQTNIAGDSTSQSYKIPHRFLQHVNRQSSTLQNRMDRQTARYLKRLLTRETKLKAAFGRLDSNATKNLFRSNPQATYQSFRSAKTSDTLIKHPRLAGGYLPYLDSLQGALSFLKEQQGNPQLSAATGSVGRLESSLQKEELIRIFINQRKEQIKTFLSQQTHVPAELQSIYQNYNKELFYYTQQVDGWRQSLNDPGKLGQTALQDLNKLPAFQRFMQQHSFLSALTGPSPNYNMGNALAGLQNKESVNKIIGTLVSGGGEGASNALSQNLQGAQARLDALKNKVQSLGAGSTAADLPPSFQPNPEKTHTFGQRLQLGLDCQTAGSTTWFPVTTALGLSLGYKLNNRSVIGAGLAYRLGWGRDIDHIHFTSQGVGLRSFVDVRVKRSWAISGGFEYNYQQPFTMLRDLQTRQTAWSSSGLIGLSKTVAMHSKFFRNAQVKLLWDFLSYQQVPQTQPLLFRIGYTF